MAHSEQKTGSGGLSFCCKIKDLTLFFSDPVFFGVGMCEGKTKTQEERPDHVGSLAALRMINIQRHGLGSDKG